MSSSVNIALELERICGFLSASFSGGRRNKARLVNGDKRGFGLNPMRNVVNIPYPLPEDHWTLRSISCGIALQSSPSKDQIAQFDLNELSARERKALTIAEGEVALSWASNQWPGLTPEFQRLLPDLKKNTGVLEGRDLIERALSLARTNQDLICPALLGQLPTTESTHSSLIASIKRLVGQMPWSSKRKLSPAMHTIPVAGDGGVKNPNMPPPSNPEDENIVIDPEQRIGIPYPEWNAWKNCFIPNHVTVLERHYTGKATSSMTVSIDLQHWFKQQTQRAIKSGLEDGNEVDVDRYIEHFINSASGAPTQARIFRELAPTFRDVSTAILLDGSSSLGAHQGRIFNLELACADALSQAMTSTKEQHALFVFSGNSRHRVDVVCLKDFNEQRSIAPSSLGIRVGGYTRLGAPIRHITTRLLKQPSQRRLLIIIGDGLISDIGYEGRYAWADVSHAAEEAEQAGLSIYYIGVGPTQVDPLPDVFGTRRSTRIRRVEDLPRVLASVHRQLATN